MYEEWTSALPGAVVWRKAATGRAQQQPVTPDGCMDLIWVGGELLVAGPDTEPNYYTSTTPAGRLVGLRFAPGLGPRVLGVPAHRLRDARLPLSALWPAGHARRLAEQVSEAAAPHQVLEDAAERAVRDAEPVASEVVAARRLAVAGEPVAAIAHRVGLSERQLHRRCVPAFGYGPKMLARISRMQRAVELARRGVQFAAVAAAVGYADQAHLSREVRALTDSALTDLVVRRS